MQHESHVLALVLALLILVAVPCRAASATDCRMAVDSLLKSARCVNKTKPSSGLTLATISNVTSQCTPEQLSQLQPTLTVAWRTGGESVFTSYLRAYNASRDPGTWSSVIVNPGSAPSFSGTVSSFDVYISTASDVGSSYNIAAVITNELLARFSERQVNYQWMAVDAMQQAQAINYGVKRMAVLLGGAVSNMFYRHDILKKANMSVNYLNTWGGVMQLVSKVHGKDWDGDGQTEFGFCFQRGLTCAAAALFGIRGPISQTRGTFQGGLVDVFSGRLQVNTPAFQLAMYIYQWLSKYAPKDDLFACDAYNKMFAQGRCVITLSQDIQDFKAYSQANISKIRGKFSAVPWPGSDLVVDRSNDQLVPCGDLSCPLANQERPQPASLDDSVPYIVPSDYGKLLNLTATNLADMNVPPGGKLLGGTRLNRVPTYNIPYVGLISGNLTWAAKLQAMKLLNTFSTRNYAWDIALNPGLDVGPMFYSQVMEVEGQPPPEQRWIRAGLDPVALPSYLSSLSAALDWSNNAEGLLQFPNNMQLLYSLLPLAGSLNSGVNPANVVKQINASLYKAAVDIYGSWDAYVKEYKFSLSFLEIPRTIPSPPPMLAAPPPLEISSSSTSLLGILLGSLIPGVGAIILCVVLYVWLNKARHKDIFGRIKAPKAAADTTVLIAKLQDMEGLRALCADEVQARALDIWSSLTNQLLSEHGGYVMPTSTNDCLRAVFFCPADAAACALRLHQELLSASWPRRLVETSRFAPVYMEPLATTPLQQAAGTSGNITWSKSQSQLHPEEEDVSQLSPGPAGGLVSRSASTNQHTDTPPRGLTSKPLIILNKTPSTFADRCCSTWQAVQTSAVPEEGESEPPSTILDTAGVRVQPTDDSSTGTAHPTVCSDRLKAPSMRAGTRSWAGIQQVSAPSAKAVLVSKGLQACVSLCAVCGSEVHRSRDSTTGRVVFSGQPLDIAESLAAAGQGGMTLVPQQTFRQLPVEVMSKSNVFLHWGEYQFTPELMALDVYLSLDKHAMGRLALYRPLTVNTEGLVLNPGVLAAPVERAAMAFTHLVGLSTLMAWNYDLASEAVEIFTQLAMTSLKAYSGYLVEHVTGFLLSAFQEPGMAILWALQLQDFLMQAQWNEELLAHELCEEVIVASEVERTSTESAGMTETLLYRGPRLKAGIDVGPILSALNTVSGRMAYRGKVMNRAARVASAAASGQVLCSHEALMEADGASGINDLQARLLRIGVSENLRNRRASVLHVLPALKCGPGTHHAPPEEASSSVAFHNNPPSPSLGHKRICPQPQRQRSFTTKMLQFSSMFTSVAGTNSQHHDRHTASRRVEPFDSERSPALLPKTSGPRLRAVQQPATISVESKGHHQLKGIAEPFELYHCFRLQPGIKVVRHRLSQRTDVSVHKRTSMASRWSRISQDTRMSSPEDCSPRHQQTTSPTD